MKSENICKIANKPWNTFSFKYHQMDFIVFYSLYFVSFVGYCTIWGKIQRDHRMGPGVPVLAMAEVGKYLQSG